MITIEKINLGLRKIGIPLNIINIAIGLIMGVAYVYLPFTSIVGLVLGIVMAISGSATIGISYFFTSKNTKNQPKAKTPNKDKQPSLKNTTASNVFLAFAIPMIFLNSGACFFGMYTGILLLASALTIPLAPGGVLVIAIVLATLLAAGTLINSWLQTHNLWQSLKKPMPVKEKELTQQKKIAPKLQEIKQEKKSEYKNMTPKKGSDFSSFFHRKTTKTPSSMSPKEHKNRKKDCSPKSTIYYMDRGRRKNKELDTEKEKRSLSAPASLRLRRSSN